MPFFLYKYINRFKKKFFSEEVNSIFFGLSSREQKKIIKQAARGANEDQRKLVEEYHKKYGRSKA